MRETGHANWATSSLDPTLASRGGFSNAEEPVEDIVVKIAELVGTLGN